MGENWIGVVLSDHAIGRRIERMGCVADDKELTARIRAAILNGNIRRHFMEHKGLLVKFSVNGKQFFAVGIFDHNTFIVKTIMSPEQAAISWWRHRRNG